MPTPAQVPIQIVLSQDLFRPQTTEHQSQAPPVKALTHYFTNPELYPFIEDFLQQLDEKSRDTRAYRNYTALTDTLCKKLEFYQIHEIVDGATRSGEPGGEWIRRQINSVCDGEISPGKANALFQHMESRVNEIRGV